MNKTNKVIIGAILILFIGFLISYNGNIITGGFSKDVTGKAQVVCSDSDDGKDYLNKGTCTPPYGFGGSQTDSCTSITSLKEWFCDGSNNCKFEMYDCWRLGSDYECKNGACVEICSDTDGGKEYFIKGTVTGPVMEGGAAGILSDSCKDDNNLFEMYCDENKLMKQEVHLCENGCVDGACIAECNYYHGDETGCKAQNAGAEELVDDCARFTLITHLTCEQVEGCEWYEDAPEPKCKPKTTCVYRMGKCCGDKEEWNSQLGSCEPQSSGELCFSFWPDKKETGKSVDYNKNEVCWDIGSIAYGYWVSVIPY